VENNRLFSKKLEVWLKGKHRKTLADLIDVFSEKSFAVSLLLLMVIPALPLPTGGVTHIFEIVSVILAIELIVGRRTIWLPKRWQTIDLSRLSQRKTVNTLINKLNWVEKYTKPRLKPVIENGLFLKITGLFIGIFCVAAFFTPPFSGLDTLPSLAVVIIALSIIFEDIFLYIFGMIVGVIGISTILILGTILIKSLKLWF